MNAVRDLTFSVLTVVSDFDTFTQSLSLKRNHQIQGLLFVSPRTIYSDDSAECQWSATADLIIHCPITRIRIIKTVTAADPWHPPLLFIT